jgi:hypothetical protein
VLYSKEKEAKQSKKHRLGEKMRGIGGPLLCIGDLLSDVGEENEQEGTEKTSPSSSLSDLNNNNNNALPQPLPHLTKLFQVPYFSYSLFLLFSQQSNSLTYV